MRRRDFLRTAACGAGAGILLGANAFTGAPTDKPIDRHALVSRHNVTLTSDGEANARKWQAGAAFQVGNGELAFAVDLTGLQTYTNLGTYSQWGWHSFPKPDGLEYKHALRELTFYGRKATYAHPPETPRGKRAFDYFRLNPHRLHLGCIRFELDGRPVKMKDLAGAAQTLDLWTGIITSTFELAGRPMKVITCCHPELDTIAARVESPLLAGERIRICWDFPYMGGGFACTGDWSGKHNKSHQTKVLQQAPRRTDLLRTVDKDRYRVSVAWSKDSAKWARVAPHRFVLSPGKKSRELEIVTAFARGHPDKLPTFAASREATVKWWKDFWTKGAAVDLSGSKDPRWKELERRIVISQYITAVNCAGSSPPQETGLFGNTWYGKFHLEMIAWHGVHFALWKREGLLERWMEWMRTRGLKGARQRARRQGFKGARWNKMIDRGASWESPSWCGPYRLTQQGHAIYMPELLYRIRPTRKMLERYKDVVLESAEFMADFLGWDEKNKRYVLGPPLMSGAEASKPTVGMNSTVELSYWAYGLQTAQEWRKRLGMKPEPAWDHRLKHLSKLPVRDGVYLNVERGAHWDGRPAWLEAYGCMPGVRIDPKIMDATFERMFHARTWGCDYPMFAMTAARLGKPKKAINWLLHKSRPNTYLPNGANLGGPAPYYPGNGGLLWAIALMAAGWDGGPDRHAPGFPDDGSWTVRWEDLRKAP